MHICIVGALPSSLHNFRGELIKELISNGHKVTALAGSATQDDIDEIIKLGATFESYAIQRNGLNPIRDIQTLLALATIFRRQSPDIVLAYTIKPIIWGGLSLMGVKNLRFYALVEGLGFAFQSGSMKRDLLTGLVTLLYRKALSRANRVIFLNKDNESVFISRGIVSPQKSIVVDGAGVNIEHFPMTKLPTGEIKFLLIARLLREKGIHEYIDAAKIVKIKLPQANFQLVGEPDPSPDGIPLAEILNICRSAGVEYQREVKDVRPFIENCHIYVLPSYHEGVPRTVLEAMAMGRPILTTDAPGCRETVVNGGNGYLVPAQDAAALSERMIWFAENRGQWQEMGRASRKIVEERFEVRRINSEMLSIMGLSV